jgi:hypothetical protein
MNMTHKQYVQISSLVFAALAVLHLARLLLGWDANVADWDVPRLLSFVVVIVAGYLAYQGMQAAKR